MKPLLYIAALLNTLGASFMLSVLATNADPVALGLLVIHAICMGIIGILLINLDD